MVVVVVDPVIVVAVALDDDPVVAVDVDAGSFHE